MSQRRNPWLSLGWQTMSLGAEAASVIGLRTAKIAAGGPAATAEAELMVKEKIAAALALQGYAPTVTIAGTTTDVADPVTVLPYLGNDSPALQMQSPDQDKVVAWLKERNSPTGSLPAKMTSLPSVGCETLAVRARQVALGCVPIGSG